MRVFLKTPNDYVYFHWCRSPTLDKDIIYYDSEKAIINKVKLSGFIRYSGSNPFFNSTLIVNKSVFYGYKSSPSPMFWRHDAFLEVNREDRFQEVAKPLHKADKPALVNYKNKFIFCLGGHSAN